MNKNLPKEIRKSHIENGEVYFWTATINKWNCLLFDNRYKKVILDSWQYLSDLGKIDVFAFVIMPNHIHNIWRINEPNGKESSQGSFLKYTAHCFKKLLTREPGNRLDFFRVEASNKDYEFWKRDSLAIRLFSKKVALQKLNYIHNNPLAKRWHLVNDPCDYYYSSAKFYEQNEKNFPFLKNLWELF